MSAPPGFGGPSSGQPNGDSGMEGDFFGTLTQAEIDKKARKWRQSQKRRFDMKRRAGGGGGIDMGKAVSCARWCAAVASLRACASDRRSCLWSGGVVTAIHADATGPATW